MKYLTIRISKPDAEALGLIVCKSCGSPENNHWDKFTDSKRRNAHDPGCAGWKPRSRRGKIIK